MTVAVAGLSHRVATLAELAELTPSPAQVEAALDGMGGREAVVLATCNRVEVYTAVAGGPGAAREAAAGAWAALGRATGGSAGRATGGSAGGLVEPQLVEPRYLLAGPAAARHLFLVTCGLDSLLVGEEQIRGQVRRAYQLAADRGLAGRELHPLFQRALRFGKRAGGELAGPAGGRRAGSLAELAVRHAERLLGSLTGRSALLVGAGATGSTAGEALRAAGAGELLVANRTARNARLLAERLGGRTVPFDGLSAALAGVDVVVSATAAPRAVLTAGEVAAATSTRPHRPLVLLDLAMPHDVDGEVRGLPGVRLVDLADLAELPDLAGIGQRPADAADDDPVGAVSALVDAEVDDYLTFVRHAGVGPVIGALHELAGAVVDEELARLYGRAPGLDPRLRAEVERTARRIVRKLLHGPAVRARDLSGRPDGQRYLDAIGELFRP